MAVLTFDCRYRYPTGFALDVAFEIPAGVTALIGPSGAGKTTILGLLSGLLRPSDGIIRMEDATLVDTRRGIWLRPEQRRLGVVFQDHLLFPHLTVQKNLLFGMRHPESEGHAAIDFDRVVEILDVRNLLRRMPKTLSGGERQRVALGRALLCRPKLLLLDEPLVGVDRELKQRIVGYLERVLLEWKVPTLIVSHDHDDVERLTNQFVCVDSGRVCSPPSDSS